MGNRHQTKSSGSYSLKYSHNETLVDQSRAVKITGNMNGYQASATPLDIYNVRHIKIEFTPYIVICVRIELCGEVQLPAPVENLIITPSNFSVHLSWTSSDSKKSSYVTHFIIYLDGKVKGIISRETNQFTIPGLKPNTTYNVGIVAEDNYSEKSRKISNQFKTKEAVENFDDQISDTSLDITIPLIVGLFCFLLLLGVIVYFFHIRQRRLRKHNNDLKIQISGEAENRETLDHVQENADEKESIECTLTVQEHLDGNEDTINESYDDVVGHDQRNSTRSKPETLLYEEPSAYYKSLNDNGEIVAVYQPLVKPLYTKSDPYHTNEDIDETNHGKDYVIPAEIPEVIE